MSITLLPYELLQLISSSLLPRYQCRLALTSRHNYKYLYTDLLRWHARKDALSVPKYKSIPKFSLIQFGKNLTIYENDYHDVYIHNIAQLYIITPKRNILMYDPRFTRYTMGNIGVIRLCKLLAHTNFLNCYKHMHRNFLRMYLDSRHPLISMPWNILCNIMSMLSQEDAGNFTQSSIYLRQYF